ncbi:MAG TPA: OmpA family protein [Candidatus Kapabacteria bacterium]|nr:OmpA family protein [Candidatus Kapabacteria bacterium]
MRNIKHAVTLIILVFAWLSASAQFSSHTVVLMEGVVLDEGNLKPIGATIEVFDPATHEKVNSYKTNVTSGSYSIVLKPSQHFTFRISSKGYFTTEEDVRTPASEKYEHITRDFSLKPANAGAEIPMIGRLFEFKKKELSVGADEDLADLAHLLTLNPDAKISVVSYPDQASDGPKNIALTNARAQAVKEYLIGKGIEAVRIQTAGNAEMDPAAKSTTRRHAKGKNPIGKVYIRVVG